MRKLTELEKMKYWMDAELTILHIMFAVIMWQLTEGWLPHIILGIYIVFSLIYTLVKISYIAADDPDYLKAPKK